MSENAIQLKPTRLPFIPQIEEKFGVDKGKWKVLVEAVWPEASSIESVAMALSYCQSRQLDPLKRVVHIVPIWDRKRKCMVDTVWPGIGELRTTAFRTKCYAGQDPAQYGPDITKTWGDTTVIFPEWCQVTVYRMVQGMRCAFAGHPVYWEEEFASRKDGSPNSMWCKRPRGQIAKVAEASALRLAFPEELGDEPTDAEGPVIVQEGHNGFHANELGPAELRSQKLLDGEPTDGQGRNGSPVQEQGQEDGEATGLQGGPDDPGDQVRDSGLDQEGPEGGDVHVHDGETDGEQSDAGGDGPAGWIEPPMFRCTNCTWAGDEPNIRKVKGENHRQCPACLKFTVEYAEAEQAFAE